MSWSQWNLNQKIRIFPTTKGWKHLESVFHDSPFGLADMRAQKELGHYEDQCWTILLRFATVMDYRLDSYFGFNVELDRVKIGDIMGPIGAGNIRVPTEGKDAKFTAFALRKQVETAIKKHEDDLLKRIIEPIKHKIKEAVEWKQFHADWTANLKQDPKEIELATKYFEELGFTCEYIDRGEKRNVLRIKW